MKLKKAVNVFASVMIFFALILGSFVAGFLVGQVEGYNQRRDTEISISNMLADRGHRIMSKKRY